MTAPQIPPRPARTQNVAPASAGMELPKVPPRPKRSIDRSVSPNRDAFARSPLNDPAFLNNAAHHRESRLTPEVPARPPSVTLPSIGQEGSEYASLDELQKTLANTSNEESPQRMQSVGGDLPMHAPKASLPASTAKSRIQTVTRTDSSQAAAAGIGKPAFEDKVALSVDTGRSGSSVGNRTRPASIAKEDDEQGIPEIGLQVPMYPNAGDVQAPTPAPSEQGGATGVGFFNKPGHASGRHHGRTKSGREIFHGPPGSYGLHGHGVIPNDEFEQKWYAKHPDDLKREKAGEYGPHIQENRKDYHWVGDDLVKLVHSSSKGTGMGTSREAVGTPDEQIGYMATDEYASRMASPRPGSGRPASVGSKSGIKAESPLRQRNLPAEQLTQAEKNEDEEVEEVIHIDPPAQQHSKIHGGGYDPPTEDLGPEGGNTEERGGWVTEEGYGVPILASDEVEKHPDKEWREPAVPPEIERGSADYTVNEDGTPSYITKIRTHSRSSSRNSGLISQRFATPVEHDKSGTPLESMKEYEPLFPEDEVAKHSPKSAVDKPMRPDSARHHFPSQDVWEDTPSSLQLETTVETPQAPEETEPRSSATDAASSEAFEKPEAEEARKQDITAEDQKSFLSDHTKWLAKSPINRAQLDDRPGMQQRFPSHDIWEDAPEHGQLVTTVDTPQSEETGEYVDDAPTEKPTVPARPGVPARPQKAKETSPVDKKAPLVPERPKPQVPVRPARTLAKSSEKVPTLESQRSQGEAEQPKAKPVVPARPGGNKISSLQAGFLKDLNSKLGLGPQAPKVKEPEPEKEEEPPKPLQDARKGRAKGPQRRKPTSSPSPASCAAATLPGASGPSQKLGVGIVTTVWSIGEDGDVDVPAHKLAQGITQALRVPEREEVSAPAMEKEAEPEETELAKTATKESRASNAAAPEEEEASEEVPLEKKSPEAAAKDIPGAFDPPLAEESTAAGESVDVAEDQAKA